MVLAISDEIPYTKKKGEWDGDRASRLLGTATAQRRGVPVPDSKRSKSEQMIANLYRAGTSRR